MEGKQKKIENFFRSDIRIKKDIYDLAPSEVDNYSIETRIKYGDRLYEAIKDIQDELLIILNNFNLNEASSSINELFEAYKRSLLECNYDYNKMKSFYKVAVTSIDKEVLDYIRANTSGYKIDKTLTSIITKCTSINELLHAIHSYLVNDENIYKDIKVIKEKENNEGNRIILEGSDNDLALELFKEFPFDIESDEVRILVLDNRILLMIRDIGHVLSIEIVITPKDIEVSYHIPKLCDIDKINKLKGITKVENKDNIFVGANGKFITTKKELNKDIFSLIKEVPTDLNIKEVGYKRK